jgi:hypothetical protein
MNTLEQREHGCYKYDSGTSGPIVQIEVDYELGGSNMFSGGFSARGIYVYVRPMTLEDGCRRYTLLGNALESGRKFFVLPLARKNDKKITQVAEYIDPIAAQVAALWKTDHNTAVAAMKSAVEAAKAALLPKKAVQNEEGPALAAAN